MALFKNLYLDLRFLNPFRNLKKKESREIKESKQDTDIKKASQQLPVPESQPEKKINEQIPAEQSFQEIPEKRQLPEISKKLLSPELKQKEQKKYDLPKINKIVPQPKKIEPESQPEKKTNEQKTEKVQDKQITQSFFSNLQTHISKEESYINSNVPKDVLYNNLFSEMKSFWQDKNYNMNKEVMDNAIKKDVSDKIIELQNMEIEWQRLQLQHDRLKDELDSKEIVIENKIKQLKKTFKKIHMNAHTHPDHHFVLSNGSKLKSMQELSDELLVMDDIVYSSHVNQDKNDFANWVGDVMNLKELSHNLRSAKNKEHMSSLIKNWHEQS